MKDRLYRAAAVAVFVAVAIWSPSLVRSNAVAAAAPTLTDLRDVDELKTLFNHDSGKVRLVLLISPT